MNERFALEALGITESDAGFGGPLPLQADVVRTKPQQVVVEQPVLTRRIPQPPAEAPNVLAPVPNEHNWRTSAACLDEDPEQFFVNDLDMTGNIGGTRRESVEATKAICARCIVTDFCLRDAIKNDERFGIWGGLTTAEREALRRRVKRSVR